MFQTNYEFMMVEFCLFCFVWREGFKFEFVSGSRQIKYRFAVAYPLHGIRKPSIDSQLNLTYLPKNPQELIRLINPSFDPGAHRRR